MTSPKLTRCNALSPDRIHSLIEQISPKVLRLSMADWVRVYEPPLRPQKPMMTRAPSF